MVDCTVIQPGLMTFGEFKIYYNNEDSCRQTLNEIFDEEVYFFKSSKTEPFILDGGANIGISVLYFKRLYPNARVICFEPDPNAYKCLIKNIEVNQLRNIKPINAALSDTVQGCRFYGEITGDTPDSRGNSIVLNWGMQRQTSSTIEVKTVVLSSYISTEVDFLKLDIEGAELIVLEEIVDRLKCVREMIIEIHETKEVKGINTDKILYLLNCNGFISDKESREIIDYLPPETLKWAKNAEPSLCIVKAKQLQT